MRKFLRKIDVFVTFFRNFSERNVFYHSQWNSCRNGGNFDNFFTKRRSFLKNRQNFQFWGGIWSKNWPKMFKNWPKCPNLKRFCQRKWQDLAKFSIWGGIWSKNWPKCSNFKRFFQTEWPKPAKFSNWGGICSRNWQKFANFKRSFQREWPKPAKFSNWVGFGPKIGQNVQILSGFFSKRVTKTNKIFKLGGDLVQKLA